MLLPFIVFLCWGSFLNMFAYRLIAGGSLTTRSACPKCHNRLMWYDLIPLLSWIALRGKCRSCGKSISILYPLIELLTAIVCSLMVYYLPLDYFFAYFIFVSALIVTIRTDAEFMLIPQLCSLYLVPVGIAFSFFGRLPISVFESIAGAALGYGTLALIALIYKKRTGHTGLGDGDPELMAGIGSFVGITGVWYTLLIGSVAATAYAVILMQLHHATGHTKIPFGPFLALGAIATLFLL